LEGNARLIHTMAFGGDRALDKFGNAMPQTSGAPRGQRDQASSPRLNILAASQKRHAHWLVARRSSDCLHLDKAVQPTRSRAQSNDASIYCVERNVSMIAMINLGAQSGLHARVRSQHCQGLRSFPGTCGEIRLRGSRWLGPYLTRDKSDSVSLVSRRKKSCVCQLMYVHELRRLSRAFSAFMDRVLL
jgi:hypothetical protein